MLWLGTWVEKHQNIIIQSRYQGYEIMFLLFRLKMKAGSNQIFWICNQIIRKSGQGKRPDREVDPWNPPANDAAAAAAAAKSLQSCPTLCSPGPGILQARTLEWVAIAFSNAWKWKVKVKVLSPVWLLATPWTAAYQAPPSMGFSRQGYWSGVPLPSPANDATWLQSEEGDEISLIKQW